MERGDAWHWTMRLKDAPEQVIGVISLMKGTDNDRGFWVGLEWQGRGFATEAAEAVTDYWFDTLKFPVLRVPKAAANRASRRISERQQMRLVATEAREYVSGRALTGIGRSRPRSGAPERGPPAGERPR